MDQFTDDELLGDEDSQIPEKAVDPVAQRYEVWYAPVLQRVRILEDRKTESAKFGTRLALVVNLPSGEKFLFSVVASLRGNDDVEEIRSLGVGAYRIEQETEKTYLGAWGMGGS